MSLIYFDGFQDDATNRKPEWTGSVSTAVTGRDGSANGAKAGGNVHVSTLALPSAAATVIVGIGWNVISLGRSDNGLILGTGATDDIWLWFNPSGYLEARRTSAGGQLIVTSTVDATKVPNPRWAYVEVKAVLHATVGSIQAFVDGIEAFNISGVSTGTVTGSCTYIKTLVSLSQTQFDDLYVCDGVDATATQGRANNNFLGDMKVTTLIPSADGDVGNWSKSTGTNGAALVDEVPPNTTDYVFSSTSGQQQLFQLPDLPGSAQSVYGVRTHVYGLNSDAGAQSVKPLYKESGGTVTAQVAIPFSATAAGGSGGFLFTKPSASTTPWSVADVNGLQAGVQLT